MEIRNFVNKNGLHGLLAACQSEIKRFESLHRLRRDFCQVSCGSIDAIITQLLEIQRKYGYVAGKEE